MSMCHTALPISKRSSDTPRSLDSPPDSPSPITPHTQTLSDTEFDLSEDEKTHHFSKPARAGREHFYSNVERERPRSILSSKIDHLNSYQHPHQQQITSSSPESRRNSEISLPSASTTAPRTVTIRPAAGMGITFPGKTNPFPAELSTPRFYSSSSQTSNIHHVIIEPSSQSSSSDTVVANANTNTNTEPNGNFLAFPKHRTKTPSPHLPTLQEAGGFSTARVTSGGYSERTGPGEDGWIERTPPPVDVSNFPSPPADGKKEPSIVASVYDKTLSWAQQYTPIAHSAPGLYYTGQLSVKLGSSTVSIPKKSIESSPKPNFTDSAAYWLCLYFFFNLGLTLFNKIVLVSFPFPYTLTGLHALSACAGCYIALDRGAFTPARLSLRDTIVLTLFSVLYTINIAVSNLSLHLVTVPFHQVVRASTPFFTILIAAVFLKQKFSIMKLVSLLPVVIGVGFATYGDYYFTAWGLVLTILGTFLAALKTIVTNVMQTGDGGRLKLHPLDLLMRMSPLAFIQCVLYGWYTGELERVREYGATQMTQTKAIALLCNGIIACGLNIVSFTANKKAGALTMTVSANCKQVLTIALAVCLFNLHITLTNGIGILLTLVGCGWYAYVEYVERNKRRGILLGKGQNAT